MVKRGTPILTPKQVRLSKNRPKNVMSNHKSPQSFAAIWWLKKNIETPFHEQSKNDVIIKD